MFSIEEIQKLTSIVDFHNSFFAVQILGKEVLDDYDKFVLKTYGIDVDKINNQGVTPYFQSLMWGRLSAMLTEKDAKDINYVDFEKYIKQGQYIPLSKEEQKRYEYSKQKTYTHLKGLGTKIKNDIHNTLLNESEKVREEYEKVIHDEIERGVKERKSAKSIISEIGHKTEVWNHDWSRIVETELNNVWQLGRAQTIEERQGKEALCFKDVFAGGCRSCIKLYTTDGIGSKPKVFKLSELQANGDNIGKKQADWLPVIGSTHPHSITDKKTLILTNQGWKKIIDISVGDKVLTHKGRYKKVTDVLKDFPIDLTIEENKYIYTIYYNHKNRRDPDGLTKLNLTGEHKVLTQRGWVMVKELTIKDKMIKLIKKCAICGEYLDSYDNESRSCCSAECSNKFRTQNAYSLWERRTDEELVDLKNKISKTVEKNWEDGVHENTLIQLKSKERRKKQSQRMLDGGALKALEAQGGVITSKIQIKLFTMVKTLFEDAELEYKIFNKSLDIAIPKYKIDIEFDGSFWHKNRIDSDKKRDELLKNNGWNVLRYSDKLPKLGKLRGDIENIIQNDDHLFKFEEIEIAFIKRSYSDKKTFLYDLTVEEDESFIAKGVVIHNCRCSLRQVPEGYEWNEESGRFELKKYEGRVQRTSKIKITIGDKVKFI